MSEYGFLSESRQKIVNGETDEFADGTVRAYRHETKKKARMAIQELIQIANSTEFENRKIFDPQDIDELLEALLEEPEPVTPLWEYEGDHIDHMNEYGYQHSLVRILKGRIDKWDHRLNSVETPTERLRRLPGPGYLEQSDG